MKLIYEEISDQIIGSAFTVIDTLGCGFLESVYRNALLYELQERGLVAEKEKMIQVFYKNQLIGKYYADIIVENKVIIELKSTKQIIDENVAQCINYLTASKIELCLLMNFGNPTLEFQRIVKKNNQFQVFT